MHFVIDYALASLFFILAVRQAKSSRTEHQRNIFHFSTLVLPKNATNHPVAYCPDFNRQICFSYLDFWLPQSEIFQRF